MNGETSDVEIDRWTTYYAMMLQKANEQEIKKAVEDVKNGRFSKTYPKRRKRGYWTPVGFYWFRRNRTSWRNYKKKASNGNIAMPWRKG